MARPKSTKPTKSKKISARLTEADYMKIKAVYGSIQAFLDLIVKTLPILILVSCGQAGDAINTGSENLSKSIVVNSRAIEYSCDGLYCVIIDDNQSYTMVFTGTIYYEGNYCIDDICNNYKFSPSAKTLLIDNP